MSAGKLKGRAKPYRVRIDVGGRKQALYFRTKKEMDEFKARRLLNPELFFADPNNGKKLFGVFADEYLAKKLPDVAYATGLKYSESVRLYLKPHFGFLNLREIRETHIVDFKLKLMKQDISPSSRVFHFNFLRSILKNARSQGLMAINPFINVKGFPKPKPRQEAWSEEELIRFLTFHKDNPKLILYLMGANIACRIGEIWALKKSDINWMTGKVSINASYNQKTGIIGDTKNHKSRIAFLPELVCEMVSRLMVSGESEFLIPRDLPGLRDPGHAARVLKRDCVLAGVTPICFHALRHTWTTLFVEKTGNVRLAMEILGHSSIEMTNRYIHISERQIEKHRNSLSLVPNFPLSKLIEDNNSEVAQ